MSALSAAPHGGDPTAAAERQATTRPAGVRPATAPTAEEAAVQPAAAEFFDALKAGDDEEAYKLTTAGYRKGHTLDEFKEQMAQLRKETGLTLTARLQVMVAPAPADKNPRRAIAVTPALAAKTDRSRRVSSALTLEHEGGKWRVAAAEVVEAVRGQPTFVSTFAKANPGARLFTDAPRRLPNFHGRLTKLDGNSLTIEPIRKDDAGPAPAPRTFVMDDSTKVIVLSMTYVQVAGRQVPMERHTPAQRSELKVGLEVSAETEPGQDRATAIRIVTRPEANPGL